MNFNDKKTFIINFLFLVIWILIIYFIFKVAAVYLMPFLIGLLIAYSVQKPAKYFEKKTRIKKNICAALLSAFFYIFVIIIFILFFWFIFSQSDKILQSMSLDTRFNRIIENTFTGITNNYKKIKNDQSIAIENFLKETINEFVQKISAYVSDSIAAFIKKAPSTLISCIITVVATCYISKDFDRIYKFFKGVLNEKTQKTIFEIKNIFVECFMKFSIAQLLLFLLTFTQLMIGLLILNVSNFIFIALLISLVDLLPIFGTGVVLVPWAVIEIVQYNYFKGVGFVILYLTIAIVRNFIEPKILGKQIDINPLLTLIFIFLGLKLGGVIGMITLPIILTVLFTYLRQRINHTEENI